MKQIVPHINPAALLRFHIFPVLAGLLWTWLAFMSLLVIENILLIWQTKAGDLSTLIVANSSHMLLAVFVAIASEFIYRMVRITAILASRLEKVLRLFLPGLTIFVLFGSSLVELFALIPLETIWLKYLLTGCLILVVAVCIVLLWPGFRGQNLVYAFMAALLSVTMIHMLMNRNAGPGLILETSFHLLILFLFIYANVHIRYKLDLSQGWEPAVLSPRLIQSAYLLAFCFFIILLVISISNSLTDHSITLASRYITGLYLFLTLRWILITRQVIGPVCKSVYRILNQTRRLTLILFSITVITAIGIWPLLKPQPAVLANIMQADGSSAMQFTLTGKFLDNDNDQNSLWPGMDPDDENPCIRFDSTTHCETLQSNLSLHSSYSYKTSHGQIKVPDYGTQHSLMFLSYEIPTSFQLHATAKKMSAGIHSLPVLLGSDRTEIALKNMMQNLNGISLHKGLKGSSIPALFASFGYRTICSIDIADKKVKLLQLYAGCQIILKTEPRSQNSFFKSYRAYQENHNMVWHHQKVSAMSNIEFKRHLQKDISQWQGQGQLLILLTHSGQLLAQLGFPEKLQKKYSHESDLQIIQFGKWAIRSAGGKTDKNMSASRIGSLFTSPFSGRTIASMNPDRFPRYTFQAMKNKLYFYDNLTGARLQKQLK